jgi:hypothetical protein
MKSKLLLNTGSYRSSSSFFQKWRDNQSGVLSALPLQLRGPFVASSKYGFNVGL